jgi:PAS domain S-box-containing protein
MQRQKRRQWREQKIFPEFISKSGNINALLKTILEKAVQLSNADGGLFFLYDDATGMIRVRLTHQSDELKRLILKPGEGIAGKVANDGTARFTNDYFNSPYAAAKLDKPELRRSLKGVVAVPLKCQNKLFGVLVITSKPGSNRIFTHKDVERLERFSGPASTAVAVARDISLQQTILDNSPGAIIAVDRRGFITRFNKACEKITGLKKDNIIGQNITNFYYHGKKEAKRINYILFEDAFYKGGPVRKIRTEVRGRNGERIPILLAGAILRDEIGEWIGSMGLLEDLREIEFRRQEYINREHFLSMLEQYPQDTPINTQTDLRERLTKLLAKTCDFCRNEYTILFASTGEDDTVLKAIAWIGLPPGVEAELPHFNWLKCEPRPMGYDREIAWLHRIDNTSNWVSDHEWKHRVRRGIRGNNKDFFNNISCGVPVRMTDKYRAVLVFGPFPEETNLPGEADFIRNIARTINIDALGWLQNLYLRAKNKEAERSGKLIEKTR